MASTAKPWIILSHPDPWGRLGWQLCSGERLNSGPLVSGIPAWGVWPGSWCALSWAGSILHGSLGPCCSPCSSPACGREEANVKALFWDLSGGSGTSCLVWACALGLVPCGPMAACVGCTLMVRWALGEPHHKEGGYGVLSNLGQRLLDLFEVMPPGIGGASVPTWLSYCPEGLGPQARLQQPCRRHGVQCGVCRALPALLPRCGPASW